MHTAIIGGLWGDEGKGKIVDLFSETADYVVRFNGGDNAGHTIKTEKEQIILHLIPSGILRRKKNVIAAGVVINPDSLIQEIDMLKEKDIEVSPSNLYVSELAHLIMPYHIHSE